MEKRIGKSEILFWFICLGLGIIAEESFFYGMVGISYIVFVLIFYSVFFLRFRRFPFSYQRIGYLLMICIWLLSASFFLCDNIFFYMLNILVIPSLMIFHLLLVTGPKRMDWYTPKFIIYAYSKIFEAVKYNVTFIGTCIKFLKKGTNENKFKVLKKIIIGILISLPILIIVLTLLISADSQFAQLIGDLPKWINHIYSENLIRFFIILIYTFVFFGFLQALITKNMSVSQLGQKKLRYQMDGIVALTVLILLNSVYLLFTIVQFKYFFSGSLAGSFTYAQYARRGFFELLFVTVLNISVVNTVLYFVRYALKRFTQFILSLLIILSGVMLYSAFLRLFMYEEAYGFTFIRVLVHSFMLFLALIFAYTFIKIWLEKLSLFHFYFITAIIYYTLINVVDLDRVVVKENMVRYEQTGKIDLQYMNSLSYTGVLSLIDLYHKNQNVKGLKEILQERKKETLTEVHSWQSFNLERQQVYDELKKCSL
ncbi:MAG: DUF4173 domain-containing protein [Bacillota bacterium]|nr:DUF4173 domain-containing protein [Bacillota bacterium]